LAKNKSLKHKKKFPELAILETVQAGAAWPTTRVQKAYPGLDLKCPLCDNDVYDCRHTLWTCDKIQQSQEPAIVASNYLIQDLEHSRVSFFNRALVSEEEIEIGPEYNPMEEYPLLMVAVGPQVQQASEARSNVQEQEIEIEVKPVLYTPPAWLNEADNEYVDELLRQSGYDTTDSKRGYKRKRQECMNNMHQDSDPTARSSTDGAPAEPERNVARYTSSLDMSDMEIEEEEGNQQACTQERQAEAEEMDIEIEETDETPTQSIDSSVGWPSGYYFGDGSGGKYSRYPTLTRCGVGVQYVDEEKYLELIYRPLYQD